ncbi:hypothetical protein [Arthrobacter sp. FW306-04-A]|uniref:hypothetical protein n=1 Tax=Arthrobacter sp. FW306-04-A TaxID=2879619 RepID=UPI0037BE7A96|nr:hypothetical protein LFT43_16380 [Arthrobacter sp. FW306-04-A]
MTTVAIPFVRIDPSQNPNLAVRDGRDPAEPYFKSMLVAFASFRRWNPDTALEFISNAEPPKEYREHLNRLDITLKIVPFEHRPPHGFAGRFTASLYLLDALGSLSADETLIVDPDVLCVGPLDNMLGAVEGRVGVLLMDFPPTEDINGISRIDAGTLHGALGEPAYSPEHFGGEAYFIPREHVENILERSERAWKFTLERHSAGLMKFMTEEHILSYAVRGVPLHHLNDHVRRIWTTHRYRRVDGRESALTLWHLPAEKDRGFAELFPAVIDSDSWFWSVDRATFIDRAGRAMGFHHRPLIRVAKDTLGFIVNAIELLAMPIRNLRTK